MVNISLTELFSIMFTKSFPCTVCKRPNYDAKTEAFKMIGQK